jgi:peptidoglycan-associated lipoprotein
MPATAKFGPAKVGTVILLAGALAISGCKSKPPKELPPEPGAPTTSTDTGQMGGVATPGSQADFVQIMARYTNKRATVEGHADERGTREYNIALGERRANAAKNYLISLGVDPSRLSTLSYGKERPIALGSDQQAWAQNRRAVTVTID